MCSLFRGGSYHLGWGNSHRLIWEMAGNHLKLRKGFARTEEQQAWAWARGHVERVEGMGLLEDRWLQRALDNRSHGWGREALFLPFVRKTKHKATQTKWLHCTCFSQKLAHRANLLPWGVCLIELSLHYENSESWRKVLCGVIETIMYPFFSISSMYILCFFFDSALFYLYLSCVQCPYNLKHFLCQNNFKFNWEVIKITELWYTLYPNMPFLTFCHFFSLSFPAPSPLLLPSPLPTHSFSYYFHLVLVWYICYNW